MLLYIAYSLCPAHGTNVLRQKFRYYFITSNGIIILMTQLLLLGKFEYTGGPIFKVVLEC